jgi:hypothetical protein
MDFWKTMGVLLRRWYVSVPIFGLSLLLGAGVFLAVPTQYESTGTLVLTAPTSGGVTQIDPKNATGPGNPLLDFGGSLTITTQLLIQSLSSPTVQQQIANKGGASTYQAGDGQTGGPFVVVIADANSPAQAERTVNLVLQTAKDELDQRQKALDAPASTYIVTQLVVAPTPATTKIGNRVKGGGIALALGLVVALASAFALESIMTTRRRRGAHEVTDVDLDDEPVDDPDDHVRAEERAQATQRLVPAPPPRQIPQPIRAAGPRSAPHPPVTPAGIGRREQYGPGPTPVPMHKPHPAKPRVHQAPASGKPTTNGNGGNVGSGATGRGVNGNGANGNGGTGTGGNGTGNGNGGSNLEWPRAEFRSPDTSTG